MSNILCSRCRYIVPFIYECLDKNNFDNAVRKIIVGDDWSLKIMNSDEFQYDVYSVILNSFCLDEKQTNIGCELKYIGVRQEENILKFNYARFENDFIVSVTDLGIYLFRTGVGFLWYEVELPSDADVNQVILFQNEFKELAYERFVCLDIKRGTYTFELLPEKDKPILMGHWIDSILSQLPFDIKYFAGRSDPLNTNRIICDKALIFEYMVFGETEENVLFDNMFRLTNGYNERYIRKKNFKNEIIELFDNAFCYATISGCGYYVITKEVNNNFYLRTFKKRIVSDYFMLYILIQYQVYSILKFTNKIQSELSAESKNYSDNSDDTVSVLNLLETDINVFLVKSVYASVSHISHHNDYYEYLINKLKVKENIEGLTIGLESLRILQEKKEKERLALFEYQENKEKEKSEDKLNIGLGILSFLALISAISDGFGSAGFAVDLFKLPVYMEKVISIVLLFIVLLLGIVAVVIIFPSFRRVFRKKKSSKKK